MLAVLERVAAGETLEAVCKSDHRLPGSSSIRAWVRDDRDGLAAVYRAACEMQAHSWADEIVEIADNGSDLERDKVRISVRERLMRVRAPASYAPPKQVSAVSGVDWLAVLRAAGCAPAIAGSAEVVSIDDGELVPRETTESRNGSPAADGGDTGFADGAPGGVGGLSPP